MSEKIHANEAPRPVGLYPHARRVGNLLFLSGIGPRNPEDNTVPGLEQSAGGNFISFDFEAQCHSVFKNVRTVLEASGAAWEDLVDVTVFLTDMQRDFTTYRRNSTSRNFCTSRRRTYRGSHYRRNSTSRN